MPDFGRSDNEPSFDDIRRSDNFIDALAGGSPVAPEDPADAALATLLGGWRDEMRWPPATGLISEPQAIAALDAGLAEKPGGLRRDKRADKPVASVTPMRNRRGLSVAVAAAAAVVCVGGFGLFFNGPKEVRDDAVILAARTELEQVQQLVDQGQWQQAQEKLVAVSTQVASIGDEQQKQDLFDEFNDLSAKVVERNPEATAAPGIIYTVPPEATELVPAVAPPTSVPTAPSPSDSTSAVTSTSGEPSGTDGSTTSGAPGSTPASTTPTSGAPASSPSATSTATPTATPTTTPTSAAPVTTSAPAAQATSSAASSSPSAAQATSSAPVTTTSAAPRAASTSAATSSAAPNPVTTTAAAPTTTAAATTPAAPTTTAPAASAPATTTSAAPAAPAQASTTPAPAQAQTTAEPTTAAPAQATTEVLIPVTTTTVPAAG